VGSVKTIVCLLSAAYVLEHGYQAVLMAPTEILAEQHFKNAVKLFSGKLKVALLTGSTSQPQRQALQERLNQQEPLVVVGTHALLEDPVVFPKLGLVMIDEQHRFGVEQRSVLRKKGEKIDPKTKKPILPHLLLLSATPIPRTLALTAFGDLTVSSIQQKPPGRTPIKTRVIREQAEKLQAYQWIRSQLTQGRQAFFIYPLVNESEAEGFTQLKSAVQEAQILGEQVFPEFKVALLHGQMTSEEKEEVMNRFKKGETQILVSTTVIEVGVDVPNATVMFIEHSERFGLSQLHQLRGRVGRGQHASYCFLSASKSREGSSYERLHVLEKSEDGFFIAEADLKIRGPGEFLGTRQSGSLPFKIADLVRDRDLLLKARDDAMAILTEDLHLSLPKHSSFRKYFLKEGAQQFHRLMTS
jgi:ATP-dependent DNA helicase RecG